MVEAVPSERRNAIEALLTEFHWRLDNARGDQVAVLFTDDAVVETPDYRLEGQAAIGASFAARSGVKLTQHHWTSLRLTPLGDERYRAESNTIIAVGDLPAPQNNARIVMGTSTDEIVFTSECGALFAHRRLAFLFDGKISA